METDASDLMEGLYIKVEEEGQVQQRLKYVRASFLQKVMDSGTLSGSSDDIAGSGHRAYAEESGTPRKMGDENCRVAVRVIKED